MKIVQVDSLGIPEIKIVKFFRPQDGRGYHSEVFSRYHIESYLPDLKGEQFVRIEETFSLQRVVRGLYYQAFPEVHTLSRLVSGIIVYLALDLRIVSPTYGKMVGTLLSNDLGGYHSKWVWVPSGFAHGFVVIHQAVVQVMSTGLLDLDSQVSIHPFAEDIDWSLCDDGVIKDFLLIKNESPILSLDDKKGITLAEWALSREEINVE